MKKNILASILVILSLVFLSPANAENTIRQPQGRIGTYFKPEQYNPYTITNLTPQELEKLHKNYKTEQKDTTKTNSGNVKQNKIPSQQVKKEDASQKELQRQFLADKKKMNEIKKQENKEKMALQQKEIKEQSAILQKERQEQLAQQKQEEQRLKEERKEQLAKQKQEEQRLKEERKEQLAKQKQEEQRLKEEEKTILSHNKEPQEAKEPKFTFKLGKKQKAEETIKTETKTETPTKTTIQNTEPSSDTVSSTTKVTQDTDTKNIVNEIKTELTNDRPKMLEELSTLWVSAVQKSDTVYFAIMKLSNPNGEEVNKKGFKKILEPIIGAAPLVGQAFVNPALTAGSIIGSNIMGTMINDSAKTRLTKVNDADLVILARAIDELQETLLMNYMAYKGAKEEYELAIKIAQERQKEYEELNKKNSPNTLLANTFYTEALDYQYKTRQEFLMKRVVLEQMVGSDALTEIETGIKREPAEEPEQIEEPVKKEKKHFFRKKAKQS